MVKCKKDLERFTPSASKVLERAKQEALQLNHEYIGAEHILLSLSKELGSVATTVLQKRNIEMKNLRGKITRLITPCPDLANPMNPLPMTPNAKRVIKNAVEEAKLAGDGYVGTEHILFSLLREADGIAAKVLKEFGLELKDMREEVNIWKDTLHFEVTSSEIKICSGCKKERSKRKRGKSQRNDFNNRIKRLKRRDRGAGRLN